MAAEKVIPVEPGSDVDEFLKQAEEQPIIAVAHGRRFRVVQEPQDIFANYDPERVKEAVAGLTGLLKGVDVESLMAELREQRGQDSSGRPASPKSCDVIATYDPARVKSALAASAGAFASIETEALKEELREQRGQDSIGRPADR